MRSGERGFTYVVVLALVALIGLALAAVGPAWADAVRREREDDLLRVGSLYAKAIESYHRRSPGSANRYPRTLEDLLLDTRYIGTLRHLRRLYPDPVNPGQPWGVVRAPDGGIQGVYSLSRETPFRVAPVDLGITQLPAARVYADWIFIPTPRQETKGGSAK